MYKTKFFDRIAVNEVPLLKSFLIFTGSFIFGICTILPIHEIGHALSLLYLGMPNISISYNPFMGTTTYTGTIDLKYANFVLLAVQVHRMRMLWNISKVGLFYPESK